ncbi:MAG: hypothetical protein RML84_11580, partial [Anaerolineae bacterium]|nr:hypothetical protein [Anaerolineae bacterium]
PGAFTKLVPVNNAYNQPIALMLSWSVATNTVNYEVCVGTLPGNCSQTGGTWVSVNGTTFALSGLSYATTYWWQVRAVNANGTTLANSGSWWRFTTENPPASPIGPFSKTLPVHMATNVPTATVLTWTPAANATRYTVCVGTTPGLCNVVNHAEVLSPTTNLAVVLNAGTTYWWQVT